MDVSTIEEPAPLVFRPGDTLEITDGRVDYQKQRALYCILASTLFERIAFHSLTTSLVLTLQSPELLHWDPRHSASALLIFSGTTYLSTLLFAIISDAKLGRAKTIIIGFIVYLIGYTFVTIVAKGGTPLCNFNKINHLNTTSIGDEPCAPAIVGTLICIAIGAGAVQSNMAVFGAEQRQKLKTTSRYFDKYIVAVNIGSFIATFAIPWIQNNSRNYFIGYIIAVATLVTATILFGIGRPYYLHIKSEETVVMKCIPVLKSAFKSWFNYKLTTRSMNRNDRDLSPITLSNDSHSLTEEEPITRPTTFLDYAKASNGGIFQDRIVDDVKSLRSALIVYILLIPYWLIYDQMDATFPLQGEHMNWPRDKKYIVSWMSLGDPITIIIGIFIFYKFAYKYFDTRVSPRNIITKFIHKCFNAHVSSKKIITKLVIGMLFALISMCIAGIVEVFRQQQCDEPEDSKLSIYAQLPQSIFIGLAELFATVGSYEYAYFAAPRSAQSLFMSFHFCSIGISSFIGTAYIYTFPTTTFLLDFTCPKEKLWSFYTYFFNIAGLQSLSIIIIIVCHIKFRIVKLDPQKMGKRPFLRRSSTTSID